MPFYDQSAADVRCEWGLQGVAHLAPISDVVVIVDVLSFCTSVEIAVSRGAVVYPYRGDAAAEYAASLGAELAGFRASGSTYSLSPQSLVSIPAGTRLVLPSPNGSTLSLHGGRAATLAGCLRNARAVARAAEKLGRHIAVIPAGERWRTDGSLRPAFEDLVGAGAVISNLSSERSPEASAAVAAFESVQSDLEQALRACSSGKELIARDHAQDVTLAAALDAGASAPLLHEGAYVEAGMN
jgi:2-phosphosulfolactate phosphatase